MMNDIFTCDTEAEYLENKYDIHALNKLGRNALFTCSLEKTKWLVKHGIDINILDYNSRNVMMNIPSNQLDKAYYLISIGIDLSLFISHPEKLILGNIRSGPVSKVIQEHILKHFRIMAENEKKMINKSLILDNKKAGAFLKKKRL